MLVCTLDFQSVERLCSNFLNALPDLCNNPDKVLNLRHLYKIISVLYMIQKRCITNLIRQNQGMKYENENILFESRLSD